MAYKSKFKGAEIDARLEKMVNVTYAELVALRDEGKLIAGQMYRMTDYETYCGWSDTECAGHPFDLVLTALDEKTLDEKCSAIWSERDTDGYFASSNLPAWDVRYCLDNDTNRFDWAVKAGAVLSVDLSMMGMGIGTGVQNGTFDLEGTTYTKWDTVIEGMPCFYLTISDSPSEGDEAILYADFAGGVVMGFPVLGVGKSDLNGKGVVYRITDEKDNSVPYDFKNIKFARELVEGEKHYYYTFSITNNGIEDGSIVGVMVKGNYFASNCKDNVFVGDACYSNTFGDSCSFNSFGVGCYSNTFREYCSDNTFGDDCSHNTFGDSCSFNSFGVGCYSNTFREYCSDNTFGDDCSHNTFGYSCSDNTLGTFCDSNTFGEVCSNNTFGDSCSRNTFGYDCSDNTFGDDCNDNTFGDDCNDNTFGDDCNDNTFGDDCSDNTFGDDCSDNTFGYDCNDNTFGTVGQSFYMKHNAFNAGVSYIKLMSSESGTYLSLIQNYIISCVSGTSGVVKEINVSRGRSYETRISTNSSGEVVEWCPADLVNK